LLRIERNRARRSWCDTPESGRDSLLLTRSMIAETGVDVNKYASSGQIL